VNNLKSSLLEVAALCCVPYYVVSFMTGAVDGFLETLDVSLSNEIKAGGWFIRRVTYPIWFEKTTTSKFKILLGIIVVSNGK